MKKGIGFSVSFVCGLVMLSHATLGQADENGLRATAQIRGCTDPTIRGSLVLNENVSKEGIKQVDVSLYVEGLTDGKHAVHIHQTGACTPSCLDAGGHHDPGPNANTFPDVPDPVGPVDQDFGINHPFHMGDLINVRVRRGVGIMQTTTNRITLSSGRLSIFDGDGSAVIIHTNADTYCDQENELTGGCAGGPRDACGIIKLDMSRRGGDDDDDDDDDDGDDDD